MILALVALILIATFLHGTAEFVTLLLAALIIAYAIALLATLVHEQRLGHVDLGLHLRPR